MSMGSTVIDVSGTYKQGKESKSFKVSVPNTENKCEMVDRNIKQKQRHCFNNKRSKSGKLPDEVLYQCIPLSAVSRYCHFLLYEDE